MQASPEEPGAKKRRTFFGKHAKCGQCHTCLHPALKRACMVNRPPEVAAAANLSRNRSNTKALASGGPYAGGGGGGGGGATGIASAAEFLAARVDWPDDKPVPAHGVSGFKLPIDPQTRAKKWTRAWCVCPCAGSGNEACAPDARCCLCVSPQGGGGHNQRHRHRLAPALAAWCVLRVLSTLATARAGPHTHRSSCAAGASRSAAAPDWPGVIAPLPDGVPPEERAAPWPDTTTRAQSRAAALLIGDAAAGGGGDGGAAPQGGHKAAPHAVISPGGPVAATPPPKEPPPPPPPGWHVCTHPGCSRAYELLPQLKRHALTHREKTSLCPFPGCGKAFLDASKLQRHQAVHAQDRDLVCRHPGCGRVFTMPTHLSTHSRTHQPDSMTVCPYPGCDKKYALAYKIKAHIAKHIKDGDGEPPAGYIVPGRAAPGKATPDDGDDGDAGAGDVEM